MWLLGLDLGTQSVKAVVCDATLAIRGAHAVSYATAHPQPGWAEQDPRAWEAALLPAIQGALVAANASPADVAALGIAAQLDGCIAVDATDAPLHPALIWQDRRATAEASLVDAARLFALAGQVADASHFAAKLVWLRAKLNGQGVAPARYHQPTSYLVARLTGVSVMDESLASTTMLYALDRGMAGSTIAGGPVSSGVSSSGVSSSGVSSSDVLSTSGVSSSDVSSSSGVSSSDVSSSSGVSSNDWSPELCAMFGIEPGLLPTIARTCDVAGTLTADGARLTGLPIGLRVAVGTGDDFANALGAGIVAPGTILCAVGTAEVVGALATAPILDKLGAAPFSPGAFAAGAAPHGDARGRLHHDARDPSRFEPMLETHVYPVAGTYFIENPGWLSGGAVRWATKMLGLADDRALDALAATAPSGSDGVTFIPALNGAMTPVWRPEMRGALHGLTAAHGPEHIARAVLEGLAFACKDVVERLAAMGLADDHVVLAGGGAQSALWAQIRADVLGLPHRISAVTDASPLGAAMIAAVAAGVVPDLVAAAALVPGPGLTVMPDPKAADVMGEAYRRYQQLVGIALSALV